MRDLDTSRVEHRDFLGTEGDYPRLEFIEMVGGGNKG